MEKAFDLIILDFENEILKVLNKEEYNILPILVKQMVINKIKNAVDISTSRIINQQLDDYNKNIKNKDDLEGEING